MHFQMWYERDIDHRILNFNVTDHFQEEVDRNLSLSFYPFSFVGDRDCCKVCLYWAVLKEDDCTVMRRRFGLIVTK